MAGGFTDPNCHTDGHMAAPPVGCPPRGSSGQTPPKHQVNFYSDCLLGRQWPPSHRTKRRPVLSLPNGFLENQVTLEGGWIRKMGKSVNCSAPKTWPRPRGRDLCRGRPASRPGGDQGPAHERTQAQLLEDARLSRARGHRVSSSCTAMALQNGHSRLLLLSVGANQESWCPRVGASLGVNQRLLTAE